MTRSKPDTCQGNLSREQKVFYLLDKTGRGLEIGPSANPLAPKRADFNVQILDRFAAEDLRERLQASGAELGLIEEVDYVWRGEPYTDLIGSEACFDWVIASHVIEHIPNPVLWLQECSRLLKPNGVLSLAIPDKRYCFDYFSPATSTGDILDAYYQNRGQPSPGQVFDHYALASKSDGDIAWSVHKKSRPDELIHNFEKAKNKLNQALMTKMYIDVHCWRFTPNSFEHIFSDLVSLGLCDFKIAKKFPTEGCEFYASLVKGPDLPGKAHLSQEISERLSRLLDCAS